MTKRQPPVEQRWRAREKAIEATIENDIAAIIVRVDGRAFHTLTKSMEKPFDESMTHAMDSAALAVAESMPSVIAAYVQSDEISAILYVRRDENNRVIPDSMPFNGRVQKIASIMASAATYGFLRAMPDPPSPALFDGRMMVAPQTDDIQDYLMWRISDSMRNAISAAATAAFGHKAVMRLTTKDRTAMLEEQGIEISDENLFGRLVTKKSKTRETTWTGKDGNSHTVLCQRAYWDVSPATETNVKDFMATIDVGTVTDTNAE